jgi:hypothetical protein
MLPWDLEFAPDAGHRGLTVQCSFDDETELLHVSILNPTEEPIAVDRLTLTAPRTDRLAGGSAWLHGRFMQQDAFVRAFAAPQVDD